jgi:hypothetical protein
MARRVFIHVGSPKTGTTFLQGVLWSQRELARQQGLLLPMQSFHDHFLATGIAVGPEDPQPAGPEVVAHAWERLVAETSAWEGDVLVSHELFAPATAEKASWAVEAFGSDAEVHVVLTARDLVRQIPAEWQEHIKHRSTFDFEDFLAELRREDLGTWFWRVQDFADVARRWGAALPPERVHVVTVPAPDMPPGLLWERFARLLGLEPADFSTDDQRANISLGYEQTELLRRVNLALGDRLPWPGPYPADVKSVFAETVLAQQPGTRLVLTGDDLDYARRRSARLVAELRDLGVDVVGDLDELAPPETEVAPTPIPVPRDDQVLSESITALAGLLDEYSSLRQRADHERGELHRERERLESRVGELLHDREVLVQEMQQREAHLQEHPVRHLLHGMADRWAWAGKARAAVRRGRELARTSRE